MMGSRHTIYAQQHEVVPTLIATLDPQPSSPHPKHKPNCPLPNPPTPTPTPT